MASARVRTTGPSAPPGPNTVVAVLAFGGIVVALMQTVVIAPGAAPPLLLDASAADTAWAITATLLAASVATPTVGRLGDMYGKRRMLLISMVLLVVGSVIGALSDSLGPLVVGRVLQGLAAGVIPLGISIMRDELPAERLGSATAVMSASLGVGGALGLPTSALPAEQVDWHVLFWAADGRGRPARGRVVGWAEVGSDGVGVAAGRRVGRGVRPRFRSAPTRAPAGACVRVNARFALATADAEPNRHHHRACPAGLWKPGRARCRQ